MAEADLELDNRLAAGGFADMRPAYRTLLRRMKEKDSGAFAEATERYERTLLPAIEAGAGDPLAAWTSYGLWLAGRLGPGRLACLDATGLASDVTDATPSVGNVLLFLPDAEKEPAILILSPAEPSEAQRSALQLLVR